MQTTLNITFNPLAINLAANKNEDDLNKTLNIRANQIARDQEPCFRTEHSRDCAQMCEWRRECRKLKAVWRP